MHNAPRSSLRIDQLVRRVQASRAICNDLNCHFGWDRSPLTSFVHQRLKRLTFHPLHCHEHEAPLLRGFVHLDDIRVPNRRDEAHLIHEHADKVPLRLVKVTQHDLESHEPIFLGPLREHAGDPHGCHASTPNTEQKLVVGKPCTFAQLSGHGHGLGVRGTQLLPGGIPHWTYGRAPPRVKGGTQRRARANGAKKRAFLGTTGGASRLYGGPRARTPTP